ncbi:MAG TPA: formate dehydrogenase accessory sulfurtransferase FdhD, partial [Candidatus Limnocylindrales bacterium]|nr:formate dehydrogenase accessory sulfurtransferase FdhD [Candidatus Limnocylindrales bacterium]
MPPPSDSNLAAGPAPEPAQTQHAPRAEGAGTPAIEPPPALDPALPIRHVSGTKIIAVRAGELEVRDDLVVGEEPLEIRAAGPRQDPVQVAVTMRTPGYEDELAIGFLTTEGLIGGNSVTGVTYGDPGVVAEPDDSVLVRFARPFDATRVAKRNFVATASCGICGKASIDDIARRAESLPRGLPFVARSVILGLPDTLRAGQSAFDRTGGLHAAGLFETDGRLVAI